MNTTNTQKLLEQFLSDIDNKEAFNDFSFNEQMPLHEREQLFHNYLIQWIYKNQYDLITANELFDFAMQVKKENDSHLI
jgi:hypothetical protein